jgi:hypothetical protein
MLGCRSSGLSPAPSAGGFTTLVNGLTLKTSSAQKKVARPPSTAVAHGTISRRVRRVANSTADEKSDSTQTQSSSEPA